MNTRRWFFTVAWFCAAGNPTSFAAPADTVSFFGIQTHFGQGRTDRDTLLNLVQTAGIHAIRDEIYWHDVETVRDTFVFKPEHDATVAAAIARGIQPLIILDYGNSLYGSGAPRDSAYRAAYARYCREVVGRYAPMGVKHFEIWNEPNLCISGFCPWSPGPNASEYFELLKVAYAAIKSVDSTVAVIGCATSPLDEPETTEKIPGDVFIQRVFALGGGEYMDAVSFHQYPVGRLPEEWLPVECEHVRTAMGTTVLPMWITEVGHHTSSAWGSVSEMLQAQYIARAFLVGRTVDGLTRISWYDLCDDCSNPADPECRYGILRQDWSPKPAFTALATVERFVGDRPVRSDNSVPSSGVYVVRFGTSASDEVVAAWTTGISTAVLIPTNAPFVKVFDMFGNATAVLGVTGGSVSMTIGPDPQYIVPQTSGGGLGSMKISPRRFCIDSTQSVVMEVKGTTDEGLDFILPPSTVTWEYVGTGARATSSGVLSATSSGSGLLVATYGGVADTAEVSVVAPIGTYGMADFSDSTMWKMRSELMDTAATKLTFEQSPVFKGPLAARIDYSYTYQTANRMKNVVILEPSRPLLLPGLPDSLRIAVWPDSTFGRITFDMYDRDGQMFPIITSSYLNWGPEWRVIRGPGSARAYASFDFPAEIRAIRYIALPLSPVDGVRYSGTIHLDELTAKYNNRPPRFVSLPDTMALVDSLYSYRAVAVDPEGGILKVVASTRPRWMSFDTASYVLFGTPSGIDAGDTTVVLDVRDEEGATARQTFKVHVVPRTGVAGEESAAPRSMVLYQNYPNPFNPTSRVRFELSSTARVRLSVVDLFGRTVSRLTDGVVSAGAHDVVLDGSMLAGGVYFVRLDSGGKTQTRKVILLK